MSYPHIITTESISVQIGAKGHVIPRTHPNFDTIKEAIKAKTWSAIDELIDIPAAVVKFGEGKVQVVDGVVHYNNAPLHNVLTDRLLAMMNEGFDVTPLANFLDNLMQNPSATAVEELYLFLEAGKLPITEDGHFLAYKKVNEDYTSIHDGRTQNNIGTFVEMPRNQVDDRRDNHCSRGLHFCSEHYLPSFGAHHTNKVVILKINPADVVSIPSDYNNAKGRAWKYFVLGDFEQVVTKEGMNASVVEIGGEGDGEPEPDSCPECGSNDVHEIDIQVGGGDTITKMHCRNCDHVGDPEAFDNNNV